MVSYDIEEFIVALTKDFVDGRVEVTYGRKTEQFIRINEKETVIGTEQVE